MSSTYWSFLAMRKALASAHRRIPIFIPRMTVLEVRTLPSTVSGTVFEDVNYGGGPGRSLAASAGVGVPGATVELYGGSGAFQQATVTDGSGAYQFNGLQGNATYFVRVVNDTVRSTLGALDLEAPGVAMRGLAIFGFGNDTVLQANIRGAPTQAGQ